ncbi:hypothetical protein P3X46_034281 [Hevea brasiliensis]|uniref:HMA domain-containing protein n=1 Tax=Hevea brasiliensis TaxID=3981 RepID=A0ABQ9KBG2_HEVBR|nr:heavy metal-associated isoprenylated plant protein 4-like [Hevea brasiliensis]KAJ9132192.1 hypothetical protein P3X46_034281 [Hevea brasiliensis]
MASKKDEKKADEVITAVYKVNLHCQKCAQDIRKPLMRIQGVHNVEYDIEKAEIKVKGAIDVLKIHKQIEKLSTKKVELISPQIKIKEAAATEEKVVKETKEAIIRTTTVKVNMHCDKCEDELRRRLLKHQGIYNVKTDMKAQTLTVHGTIEPDKLLGYIRKKVHKNAEILTSKPEKKEEKIEEQKTVKEEKAKVEEQKTVKEEKAKVEEQKTVKEEKAKVEVKGKAIGSIDVVEFKEEKKVEAKTTEGNVPYFIHYVYAPQLFSDENPNACFIM